LKGHALASYLQSRLLAAQSVGNVVVLLPLLLLLLLHR
jgi:hypothetical protein